MFELKKEAIAMIANAVVLWLVYILILPALGFNNEALWLFIIIAAGITAISGAIMLYVPKIATAVILLIAIATIGGCTVSMPMFNEDTYKNSGIVPQMTATAEEAEDRAKESCIQAAADLPSMEDVAKISLMDTASAKDLAKRSLSKLGDKAGQYEIDELYTICYNNEIVKVASLRHSGIAKFFKNKTIPAYVIVNPRTNEASFVKLDEEITYAPSCLFSTDLFRHIRSEYKSELLGDRTFQLDDSGHPYWTVAVEEYQTVLTCKKPVAVIVVDAVTGEMEKYSLEETPEWIDYVVSGDTIRSLYNNRYGSYVNGWLNISKTGETMTTDDFGYVVKDNDVYVYTGITSLVMSDESNLGFIFVNSRTLEAKYYEIGGAEEYSAEKTANGLVQDFGYQASFPSLVMMGEEPVYVMVLKDDNGLVKQYAMVSYTNYTIGAVGDTLKECHKNFARAMKNAGTGVDIENVNEDELIETTLVVAEINYIVVDGNTVIYIKSEEGQVFKKDFASDERLILISVGDTITVLSAENEEISTLVSWK